AIHIDYQTLTRRILAGYRAKAKRAGIDNLAIVGGICSHAQKDQRNHRQYAHSRQISSTFHDSILRGNSALDSYRLYRMKCGQHKGVLQQEHL
ncbi:MAG TPA: hypothetical protein VET48_00260, partial [Steroidobacteraceae bacterium]|nr:hypothetical protein [Steroidobacteraceae bacterium]